MRLRCFLSRQLSRHGVPLLVVSVAQAAAQIATLTQPQTVSIDADTRTYDLAALAMTWNPASWIRAFRTPGYPALLRLVFALTGQPVPTDPFSCASAAGSLRPLCATGFGPVVVVQVILTVASVFGVYVLAYRLTQQRWVAAIAAILIGCNLYALSWERNIGTETLSVTLLIASFLVLERYVRRPSLGGAALLAVLWSVAILVRPFNVILPAIIVLLLVVRAAWLGRKPFLHVLPGALLILVVVYGCVGAYSLANGRLHGIYGLTFVTDANLYGKVLEYHMVDLSIDPRYAGIRAASLTYLTQGHVDPYSALIQQHGFRHMTDYGSFAEGIILHHPLMYLADSMPDLYHTWLMVPYTLYPRYGTATTQPLGATSLATRYGDAELSPPLTLWMLASSGDEMLFALLPLIVLGLLVWLWRDRENSTAFFLLCLAALVVVTIAITAFGDYTVFQRVRFPGEWAMYLLAASSLYLVVRARMRVVHP